jgi:hypothetical protein
MDKQEKAATVVTLIGIFGLLLWALLRRKPEETTTVAILDAAGNVIQQSIPGSAGIFDERLPLIFSGESYIEYLKRTHQEIIGYAVQSPFDGSYSCPSGYQVVDRNGSKVCVKGLL